jgi:hypothetical protein
MSSESGNAIDAVSGRKKGKQMKASQALASAHSTDNKSQHLHFA